MKLNAVKVKVVDGADAAGIEAAVANFLAAGGERAFVSVQYVTLGNGATRSALILYTE